MRTRQSAFTLVELSIALVILGLLVGGVLAGQSLIHASELRAITTERMAIVTAMNAFKEKYQAQPGDFKDAYNYWGAACGLTCSGDGSEVIETSEGENLKLWLHLSLAGFIQGNYTGTGTPSAYGAGYIVVSKTNLMKSKYPDAYWDLGDFFFGGGGEDGPPATWDNPILLNFGAIGANPAALPAKGVQTTLVPTLTSTDGWNIDSKTDDGRANTGNMIGDGYDDPSTGYGLCYDVDTGGGIMDYYNLGGHDVGGLGGPNKPGICQLHWFIVP